MPEGEKKIKTEIDGEMGERGERDGRRKIVQRLMCGLSGKREREGGRERERKKLFTFFMKEFP